MSMDLNDYTERTPLNTDIDPRASQRVAAAKRQRTEDAPADDAPTVRPHLPIAIGAGLTVLLMVSMATWQLGRAPARPLQLPTPTAAQVMAVDSAPPTRAPEATSTPVSSPAPTPIPVAPQIDAGDVTGALQEAPPMTGQGLTLVEDVAPPASDYIVNVGAQAEHSPRGGLCGPDSGDCAPGVPYGIDNGQYLSNVGAQAPHKVR